MGSDLDQDEFKGKSRCSIAARDPGLLDSPGKRWISDNL